MKEEDRVVTASHDEDLENLWILMAKKKQLDLDVYLSPSLDANSLKENIPNNQSCRKIKRHISASGSRKIMLEV